MIFNNILTEQEILNIIMEDNVGESGFIFRSIYDENTNDITLSNFEFDDNGVLLEANINQAQLGIERLNYKKDPRYIMITGSSSHSGRMKVSLHGKRITNNNKDQYISIYKSNNTIHYIGDLNNIQMNKKEYNVYVNLFERNNNLIQFAKISNGSYDYFIDKAFINDEDLRRKGYSVIRDSHNGNAYIYLNNKLVKCINIKGEEIKCY